MTVADASVWTSVFLAEDIHHKVSRRWLGRWTSRGGIVLAPSTLHAEVAGAVARRTGDITLGHQGLARLLGSPAVQVVPIDELLGVEAARLAADLRLRGADAVYVAVAQHFAVPLVTWDQEQLTRAATVVATRTPATV